MDRAFGVLFAQKSKLKTEGGVTEEAASGCALNIQITFLQRPDKKKTASFTPSLFPLGTASGLMLFALINKPGCQFS